jgi:hypothetical protein
VRFSLLAMIAVAAACATSNANAEDDTVICHFAGHNFMMESKTCASNGISCVYDAYRDGSYLGPRRLELDVDNKVAAVFPRDKSTSIGFRLPARGSLTPDQRAKSIIPMAESVFMIMSTQQETPGDCTMYVRR